MKNSKPYDVLEAVRIVGIDRTMKDLGRRTMKLGEETGEANNAYLSVTSASNDKKKTWDDFREEAVDAAIMGLDLALTELPIDKDRTSEEIVEAVHLMFQKKLAKWSKQLDEGKVITKSDDF